MLKFKAFQLVVTIGSQNVMFIQKIKRKFRYYMIGENAKWIVNGIEVCKDSALVDIVTSNGEIEIELSDIKMTEDEKYYDIVSFKTWEQELEDNHATRLEPSRN